MIQLPPPDAPLCASGHRPFRTEAEAQTALRTVRASRRRAHNGAKPGDVESRVWECKTCGWWHLTASKGKGSRGSIAARQQRHRRSR